jgi:hypothetical protein
MFANNKELLPLAGVLWTGHQGTGGLSKESYISKRILFLKGGST